MTRRDLAVLLGHERGRLTQPLLEALLEQRNGDAGPAVRNAADRLLREHTPWALDLAQPAGALIAAAGNERDRRLFVACSLNPNRPTFAELAQQEKICRQNVNWLVRRAESRVREALGVAGGPLAWAVSSVRNRLGTVTADDRVASVLAGIGAGEPPVAALLLWLAGPYVSVPHRPGWLAVEPQQIVVRTTECLSVDGAVRRLEDVAIELADVGIHSDQLVAWLGACGAALVHDLVVSVTGPLADAVERVLDAHGKARTAEEISADLAAGRRHVEPGALAPILRSRRFSRSANGAVGMTAWDVDESAVVAKPQPRRQGKTSGSHLDRAPAPLTPAGQERLWLWVRVNVEVLRGSEAGVPEALVEGLGLAPFARRTFSSRWGPITLARDRSQAIRSSVRAIALAAGARPDDTLLLGFDARGEVVVEVRRGPMSPPEVDGTSALLFPELLPESVSGGAP